VIFRFITLNSVWNQNSNSPRKILILHSRTTASFHFYAKRREFWRFLSCVSKQVFMTINVKLSSGDEPFRTNEINNNIVTTSEWYSKDVTLKHVFGKPTLFVCHLMYSSLKANALVLEDEKYIDVAAARTLSMASICSLVSRIFLWVIKNLEP